MSGAGSSETRAERGGIKEGGNTTKITTRINQ